MIAWMLPPAAAGLIGGGLGAIIGSFLATLVVRWPTGDSVARGRSRCDGCARVLGARDLVPIVSFVALRGRCAGCGARIAPLHIGMEVAAAVVGAAAWVAAPVPAALVWCIFGWTALTLATLDARHLWLPDRLVVLLALAGVLLAPIVTSVALVDRVIGGVAGFAALWLIAAAYRRWRGRDGLGGGDAKLLGALGLWFGWSALPLILLLASLSGTLAVLVALAAGAAPDRSTRLPFGTFLCAAALPGWLAARYLLIA